MPLLLMTLVPVGSAAVSVHVPDVIVPEVLPLPPEASVEVEVPSGSLAIVTYARGCGSGLTAENFA